ncbi:30S ribosomal protein S6 [Alkalihalobacillus sp. AL-G]|uniref:30S ribosomal protein S6 n=1 Tax=Alkalihalobacillus sp. AL-G TaxID=2926399 RepID=UPI0027297B6C|nr:30S ribosomal protein S6 [Alkalihalobacillus sp. AL-G]WLD93377.1 30S ribosomal protein S6 [Alkalihalobacillus sp. AL-G]
MRRYEIMYILRPNLEEEAKAAVNEKAQGILTDNGAEIEKVNDMGKRRLAYEINDYRDGYYTVLYVKAPTEAIDEFDRLLKIDDSVLRFMTIVNEQQ